MAGGHLKNVRDQQKCAGKEIHTYSRPCCWRRWRFCQCGGYCCRAVVASVNVPPSPPVLTPAGQALMNVPSTDFMALMYIVPPSLHRCEPVSSLKRAADSLETAKFVDFWQVCVRSQERAIYAESGWVIFCSRFTWSMSSNSLLFYDYLRVDISVNVYMLGGHVHEPSCVYVCVRRGGWISPF